jgi:hypothetical protein
MWAANKRQYCRYCSDFSFTYPIDMVKLPNRACAHNPFTLLENNYLLKHRIRHIDKVLLGRPLPRSFASSWAAKKAVP